MVGGIQLAGHTTALAVNADGSRVYAASYPSTVSVLDTASEKVIATLTYSFFRTPARAIAGVNEDLEHWEGRSHSCEGPNFGDGGIAYLFLRTEAEKPEGWFFWQCG